MLGKLVAWLKANLSWKFAPATLPAWIAVLVMLAGGGWTVFEYCSGRKKDQIKSVQKLHAEYMSKWAKVDLVDGDELKKVAVRERCEVIHENVKGFENVACGDLDEEQREQLANVVLQSEDRHTLRERIEAARGEVRVDGKAAEDFFSFFSRVQVCVGEGSCDDAAAIKLFGKVMTAYLNVVCAYTNPSRDLDTLRNETVALAQFLLDNGAGEEIPWSEDEGRENLFFCSYLRELRAHR